MTDTLYYFLIGTAFLWAFAEMYTSHQYRKLARKTIKLNGELIAQLQEVVDDARRNMHWFEFDEKGKLKRYYFSPEKKFDLKPAVKPISGSN